MTKEIEQVHPHVIAKENLEKIIADEKFSEEERNQAKLHLLVVNGIIDLACKISSANPSLCYMNSIDLIDEFLFDPMQEQS